jgi:hypothetical protein
MSYDLMVFKKESAPKTRADFMKWYYVQTEWAEDHDYSDPKVTSEELKGWFLDMIKIFPAMNGPYADDTDDDVDNENITGYTIGRDVIYVDFRWSVVEKAFNTTVLLAEKHGIGFFDVSSDNGDILFPEKNGWRPIENLVSNNPGPGNNTVKKPWWRFW